MAVSRTKSRLKASGPSTVRRELLWQDSSTNLTLRTGMDKDALGGYRIHTATVTPVCNVHTMHIS